MFVDVARELGMDGGVRSEEIGGVGPSVVDYDNDGDFDLFVAMYGPDVLWRNEGAGRFVEVPDDVLNQDYHSTSAAWGDYDNDGRVDLYVVSYLRDEPEARDHLFRNTGGRFSDVTPDALIHRGASHGVQWADYDEDGAVDLSLANNNVLGSHPLYRNVMTEEDAERSLQVLVLDASGRVVRPGSEVRLVLPDSRDVVGSRLVDTGGGYCSQSAAPVHFGIPVGVTEVDLEVTTFSGSQRQVERVEAVSIPDTDGVIRVLTAR